MDDELRDSLLSKPAPPEEGAAVKVDTELQDALSLARFCPDCPHEKADHPKKNRFRCRWCRCEGLSIKRAVYLRRRGKRMPS